MPEKDRKTIEINKHLINLVVINLFLIASCFLWLDYLGLFNFNRDIFPLLAKVPGIKSFLPKRTDDPFLLAKEEQQKLDYIKQMEWQDLKTKEKQLEDMDMKLKEKEKGIKEQGDRLKEKEKEIDNKYKERIAYNEKVMLQAVYLVSMKPDDAVKRISNMDDLLIIDIFKAIEKKAKDEGGQSMVPYYLSLMDPVRASTIQRKMTVAEEDIGNTKETNL